MHTSLSKALVGLLGLAAATAPSPAAASSRHDLPHAQDHFRAAARKGHSGLDDPVRLLPGVISNISGSDTYQAPHKGYPTGVDQAAVRSRIESALAKFADDALSLVGDGPSTSSSTSKPAPAADITPASSDETTGATEDAAAAKGAQENNYASLVNPFIGTAANSNPGNVFPGASVPFGMAKVGIDLDLGEYDCAAQPISPETS
jgi:Glycosyl hydrolase family 92 N-terminal domain